jgi:hypothetical protein
MEQCQYTHQPGPGHFARCEAAATHRAWIVDIKWEYCTAHTADQQLQWGARLHWELLGTQNSELRTP